MQFLYKFKILLQAYYTDRIKRSVYEYSVERINVRNNSCYKKVKIVQTGCLVC